jgi:purine-binding chemotaxis protein CheW
LLVDSAREVLRIPPEEFKPPPEMISRETNGFVKAVAQTQKRLVLLLDFAKVIGEAGSVPKAAASNREAQAHGQ